MNKNTNFDITEAELDKEFFDEYLKLVIKYKRDLMPQNNVIRLTEPMVEALKNRPK